LSSILARNDPTADLLLPLVLPKSGTAVNEKVPSTYVLERDVIVTVPDPPPAIDGAIQFWLF